MSVPFGSGGAVGPDLLATLLIADRWWFLPGCGLFLLAVVLLWWRLRATQLSGTKARVASILKAFALLTLAACLTEPLWCGVQARPGDNIIVLLADNSASMTLRTAEAPKSDTRADRMQRLFQEEPQNPDLNWQKRLEQDFDVRRFQFDAQVRPVDDFADLDFSGNRSCLALTLQQLQERFRHRPWGGIILVTDGVATDWDQNQMNLETLPPIFPVVAAEASPPRDLAIQNVAVTQTAFEDAPVTVVAHVAARGFTAERVVAQLVDAKNQLVKEQTLPIAEPGLPITFRFQFRPRELGVVFDRIQVAAESELDRAPDAKSRVWTLPANTREATLANNTRTIVVQRRRMPHRVLYVSGRPNWEFKFLRRAIEEDEEIDLVGLIRVAKREAKFEFRSREDESSNPLYRGFKKQDDEETERYDQPVLVRLNTKDAEELRDGFPKTEEKLFDFDAVILDDIEAGFFTHDQMRLIQRFVADRGGSLLMLGGFDSFARGNFRRTPIAEMLPVYLDATQHAPNPVHLALTRSGWLAPWVRLRPNELDEETRFESMPEFRVLNRTQGIKPGATVLAQAQDSAGQAWPALVTQRFGHGQCAAVTVGDLWRWQLRPSDPQQQDLMKHWRQTLRWLVSNVPEKLDVQVQPEQGRLAESVQFRVRVRDDAFQPRDNVVVRIAVQTPTENRPVTNDANHATKTVTFDAEPSLEEPGVFDSSFVVRSSLPQRATITVFDEDNQQVAEREVGWCADLAAPEFRSTVPRIEFLQELARTTGGQCLEPADLPDFVKGLPRRPMPMTEQWTKSIWDHPLVFLFVLACLIGEWGLRRSGGLP